MYASNVTVSENHNQAINAIMEFMDRTGYTVYIVNGQRITQMENPGKEFLIPADGCEVYFSHFPKNALEDTLFPLFSNYGKVLQMRLMMHFSGLPKGYGYAVFDAKSSADRAVSELDGLEMDGCTMRVCKSLNSKRLFVTGLPDNSSTNRMEDLISGLVDGVTKVTYFRNHRFPGHNAYCFVDFKSHQLAIKSKSMLRFNLTCEMKTPVRVTWARPQVEVDEKHLAEVKTMFIRGLAGNYLDKSAVKHAIMTIVPECEVLLIKTIRHFSFVYFRSRAATEMAIESLCGKTIGGQEIETAFARPMKKKGDIISLQDSMKNLTLAKGKRVIKKQDIF